MLLHFGGELVNQILPAIEESDAIVHALQNIAQARVQGDHIITGDQFVLEKIAGSDRLSATTKRVFRKIADEQPQFGAVRRRLAAYVLIDTIKGPANPGKVNTGSQLLLHVSLDRFQRNDVVQPAFLIAENLNDCKLYFQLCKWVLGEHFDGLLPTTLSAVLIPGGGDTTGNLVEHFSDEQRYFSLSITDSDRTHPEAKLGQTASKCEGVALTDLCHHLTLDVRSIENLLCCGQIEVILSTEHERRHLLSNLDRLRCVQGTDSWWYLPLKEGVRELVGPPRPGSAQEYWNRVASGATASDGLLFPGISSKLLSESPRVFRRLKSLRGLSHEEVEQVLTRGP